MTSLSSPFDPKTLKQNITVGIIKPSTLLFLLIVRSILCFLGQAITALVFLLNSDPTPWSSSIPYWNVFGTFADLFCLVILHYLLKKEGYQIWDLLKLPQKPILRDLLLGIGLFLLIFPTVIMGITLLANFLIYGMLQPDLGEGMLIGRQLPLWATIHSLLIWWLIWSPTESTFYNGYLFPRLEVLTGKTWKAILLVGFFWTLQHIFFPFIPDGKYLVWRFIQFIGIGFLMPWLFSRIRRLRPLIITHWLMDIMSVLLTIKL